MDNKKDDAYYLEKIVRISNLCRTNRKFGIVLSFFAYSCGT